MSSVGSSNHSHINTLNKDRRLQIDAHLQKKSIFMTPKCKYFDRNIISLLNSEDAKNMELCSQDCHRRLFFYYFCYHFFDAEKIVISFFGVFELK